MEAETKAIKRILTTKFRITKDRPMLRPRTKAITKIIPRKVKNHPRDLPLLP